MKASDFAIVIFDWSGVISDDRLPVYESNMILLKNYGKSPITFEEWLPKTTLSVRDFGPVYGITVDPEKIAEEYRQVFNQTRERGTHPSVYLGAKDVLENLYKSGKQMVVVSSHPEENLFGEAEEYGLKKYFSLMVGNSKNKTEVILEVCKKLGIVPSPKSVAYIGDTIYDIRAAKGAGVYSIGISNGYHTKERLTNENPDKVIESLAELL